jgi:hypothetical protein
VNKYRHTYRTEGQGKKCCRGERISLLDQIIQVPVPITPLSKTTGNTTILVCRFSVVIQDKVEEGLDNVVIIPISVIVLDENDNPPRYSLVQK